MNHLQQTKRRKLTIPFLSLLADPWKRLTEDRCTCTATREAAAEGTEETTGVVTGTLAHEHVFGNCPWLA